MDSNADAQQTNVGKQANGKKKEANFTQEEDIYLCRAWMAISADREQRKDSSSPTYWDSVREEYANLVGNKYVIRLGNSLPQRWCKIRGAVSIFCVIYKHIEDQNRADYSEKDKINLTLRKYKKEGKGKFKFLHCWTELRHSPKWNLEVISAVQPKILAKYSQHPFSIDNDDEHPVTTPTLLEGSHEQNLQVEPARNQMGTDGEYSPLAAPVDHFAASTSAFISFSKEMDSNTCGNLGTHVQTKGVEQVSTKKKESNYTHEEDIILCRAWMSTSGTHVQREEDDDPSTTFWARVGEKYASMIGNNYVSRPGQSVPQRFSKIRPAVLKFCSIYKKINDQNSSGYTKQVKVNMALRTYKKEFKEKFNFLHCWTVLRHSQKWILEGGSRVRGRREVMNSQQSSSGEHFDFDEQDDCPVATDTSLEQPDDYDFPMPIHTAVEQQDDDDFPMPTCTSLEQQEEQELAGQPASQQMAMDVGTPASSPSAVSTPVFISSRTDEQTDAGQQVTKKKKDSNFSQEEDIFLCRAWLSTDAHTMKGKDHSSTYWERVGEEYTRLKGNDYEVRSGQSLPQRWSKIRPAVAKFCTIYKKINDQNSSDVTELDKINMAVITYKKEANEKFKFLHCWTELRRSEKWTREGFHRVRPRIIAMYTQESYFDDDNGEHFNFDDNEHFNRDDNDDRPMPTTTPMLLEQQGRESVGKQPVRRRNGIDIETGSSEVEDLPPETRELISGPTLLERTEEEKHQNLPMRKRKASDLITGLSEAEDLPPESQELIRGIIEQKVRKLDEMLEIEREKRETKIMLIDPTTFPDGRRQYFEKLQQKILERVCGKPSSN